MTDREKAIVMAYTGCTMLVGDKLGVFYEYVREKLGRPVLTHELADRDVQAEIRACAGDDFIALAKAEGQPEWRGVWVPIDDEPHEDFECSICGYVATSHFFTVAWPSTFPYCPMCGAKMEGPEEESE